MSSYYQVPGPRRADAGLQVDHRQQGWPAGREAGQAEGPLQCVQVQSGQVIQICLKMEDNTILSHAAVLLRDRTNLVIADVTPS